MSWANVGSVLISVIIWYTIIFALTSQVIIPSTIVSLASGHPCLFMENAFNWFIRFLGKLKCILLFLLTGGLVCCNRLSNGYYFSFPVQKVEDIAESGVLKPELLYQGINVTCFSIIDSFVVSYLGGPDFASVYNLKSGEELGSFCRKGRGPGEILAMTPFFDSGSKADQVYIFDATCSDLQTWNIPASLAEGRDVCKDIVHLNKRKPGPLTLMSIYRLGDDSLLAYDACQLRSFMLTDIPRYWIFDQDTGEVRDSIKCFRKVPLKSSGKRELSCTTLMSHSSCLNSARDKMFLAMRMFPMIAIIDIHNHESSGFFLRRMPRQNDRDPVLYFSSVTATDRYVYCLYYGKEERDHVPQTIEEENSRKGLSLLYVMDWEGRLRAKYRLDDVYHKCQVSNDGLYLSRLSLSGSALYRLPLSDVVPD